MNEKEALEVLLLKAGGTTIILFHFRNLQTREIGNGGQQVPPFLFCVYGGVEIKEKKGIQTSHKLRLCRALLSAVALDESHLLLQETLRVSLV